MNHAWKKIITLILIIGVMSFSLSSQAADLTSVSDSISNHNPSQSGVTHTIKFKPTTSIADPGDLKITFANGFNLSSVASSVDVTVSGGGITWNTVLDNDLNVTTRVLTLGWTTGTLTAGNLVTVTVNFTKNPAIAAKYNITIETGPDGFSTPTDSRTIPVVITNAGVSVSANVPYLPTNPTITNAPTTTTIISSGATQTFSFTLTDVNNNDIYYTISPSGGNTISLGATSGTVVNTQNGVTINFTYFANGTSGTQIITLTANDGLDNTPAQPAQPVVYDIPLFII